MLNRTVVAVLASAAIAGPAAAGPAHSRAVSPTRPIFSVAACSNSVSWQRARWLVGRTATIRGRVVGSYFASSSSGQPTFLDMGNRYPNPNRFTVLIWRENRGTFGGSPERRFRGRSICVRGVVQSYRGVPEIIARSPTQIRIVG
jgi:hypothetical protein